MKKSAIVTLTLSLVLIMSGCSTESNTKETSIQNKWNVFAEKISDVCSNLTSTLTIECDASDLTPEQIQEFTEDTLRTRVFYMHVPVEYAHEPVEQPVTAAEETNDTSGVFLKITAQDPMAAENILDNIESTGSVEQESEIQIAPDSAITEAKEPEGTKSESNKTPPNKSPVVKSETKTETKTKTKPEPETTKTESQPPESVEEKTDFIEQETQPIEKEEPVVEDVQTEPEAKPEKEEVEETKPQENDFVEPAPSDIVDNTETVESEKPSEPEKIEEPQSEKEPEVKKEEPPQEPPVNFTDIDEYYYVSASALNFRAGPGTSYDVITTLTTNTKVHVIGKGDNGWNKIDLNGKVCYASAKYLSKNQVVIKEPEPVQSKPKESVQEEMARRGSLGRLSISSCGVNVALFSANLNNLSHGQAVVDRSDSAAYYTDTIDYWGYVLVADHVHQGFSGIKKAVVGSTIATFDFGSYQKSAVCVDRFIGYNGYNGMGGLYTTSGAEIGDRGDICMYTCNSDGTVTITFWNYC